VRDIATAGKQRGQHHCTGSRMSALMRRVLRLEFGVSVRSREVLKKCRIVFDGVD